MRDFVDVANLDAGEQAIRLAVDAAERMAGVTVESLIVNVSCGRLASETYSASVGLSGGPLVGGVLLSMKWSAAAPP